MKDYSANNFTGAAPPRQKHRSIRALTRRMLTMISVSLVLVVVLLSLMLISVNRRYEDALLCADTAADFNKEFKNTLDLAMYNHVIRPRSEVSEKDLPMEELDKAEEVLRRLEEITTLPDNQWRARSMLDMCANLRSYMIEIAGTKSYDQRMELLERNIRGETGLTLLIDDENELAEEQMTHCLRCGRCTTVCPVGLMPQMMADAAEVGDYARYEKKLYGLECMQCGTCTYICPAKRPLMQIFKQTKAEIMARKRAAAGGKK